MTTSLPSLIPLLPSHPSLLPLLRVTRPFAHGGSDGEQFLVKLTAFLGSREKEEQRAAVKIVSEVVQQDVDVGIVVPNIWGKRWVGVLMPIIEKETRDEVAREEIEVVVSVMERARGYPALERELQGVAVKVGGLIKGREALMLEFLPRLFPLAPTPLRPLVPTLLPVLHRIVLTSPLIAAHATSAGKPVTPAHRAATVLAHLHILAGKVAASPAFHTDMIRGIAESHLCLSSLIDGSLVLPPYHGAPAVQGAPVTFTQSVDTPTRQGILLGALAHEVASEEKIQPLVRALEGWMLVIHALLSFPTARPVTLPLGGIINLALRILACTPTVPFAEHVEGDASFKASFNAAMPRLWVVALKLLSACTLATEQHVMPYLGTILDHSIYLAESISSNHSQAHSPQLALLRFHSLLLSRLQTDPSSTAYHTRLATLCLRNVTRLLQQKPVSHDETTDDHTAGKKGKKRMRGAGEDAFVGSLSGRVGQGAVGKEQGKVIIAALKLLSVLLPHPALPKAMQAIIIRLLLSLSYSLETRSPSVISSVDLVLHERITRAVEAVLSKAVRLRGVGGSVGPWAGLIIDRPASGDDFAEAITTVIHPLLPPLSRPLPPIASLVFYNTPGSAEESTEERTLRADLGLKTGVGATKTRDAERTTDMDEEERKRKRVFVEVKESTTTTSTSFIGNTAAPVPRPSAVAPPPVLTRPQVSAVIPTVPEMVAKQVPAAVQLEAQHALLSVQAVPPPIVLPPDVTTASVHVPGILGAVSGDAVGDDDDFEMPEINLESDSDEEDEE
ncbi:hypothetical protein QFC21_004769 [Naganishia friedmannii]|uniref:Uncharacterized protein n=1 Tax=Naganishia friedmannii TaxID=89922 RepID=A0ACC2VF88_9TREE|nr:hypothetical protein QFC21_004769 [Naganishia friedmannii]